MMTPSMNTYWNARYADGRIWGDDATPSAKMAGDWFRQYHVANVLIPGCGYGRNSLWLAKQGFEVTAFDVSDVAIQQGIKINYFVEDLFDPERLKNKQFDGIYLSNVLHLFLANDRQRMWDLVHGLLKPEGSSKITCLLVR